MSWLRWLKAAVLPQCHFCLCKRNYLSQCFMYKIWSASGLITGLNCMGAWRFLMELGVWKCLSADVCPFPCVRTAGKGAVRGWSWSRLWAPLSGSGILRMGSWWGLCSYCIRKYLAFWLCKRKTRWSVPLVNVRWLKFMFLSPVKGVDARMFPRNLILRQGNLVSTLGSEHTLLYGGSPGVSKLKH